jgi:hypothetical protein
MSTREWITLAVVAAVALYLGAKNPTWISKLGL